MPSFVNKSFISTGFKSVLIERMLYFGDLCALVDARLSLLYSVSGSVNMAS